MQPAPVIVQQQPTVVAAPPRTVPVKETRVLGILQIVIGAVSIIFGIAVVAALRYWAGYAGFGIWGGLWILIGGIIGVCSASNPTNYCLNGTNMAFSIVSCCISFIEFIVYCVAISYYRRSYCAYSWSYYTNSFYYSCSVTNNGTGIALYSILLVAMIAEFGIALAVSIYCCKYGCSCCDGSTGGVIIQPAQPHTTFVQSSGIAYSNQPAVVSYPTTAGYAYSSYPNQQSQVVTYTTMAPTTGYAQPANPNAMTYSQPVNQPVNQSAQAHKAWAPDAPPPYANQ